MIMNEILKRNYGNGFGKRVTLIECTSIENASEFKAFVTVPPSFVIDNNAMQMYDTINESINAGYETKPMEIRISHKENKD